MTASRSLGSRVAAARRTTGMSQTALALAAGLERTALSKIEHGRRGIDPLELARVARALQRPVTWFLGGTGSTAAPSVGGLRRRRRQLVSVAARHGAHRLRVFGSVARGDARADSDVDLLVRLAPDRTLLDLGALVMDLRDILGRDVDVVPEETLRGRARQRVLREAVAL